MECEAKVRSCYLSHYLLAAVGGLYTCAGGARLASRQITAAGRLAGSKASLHRRLMSSKIRRLRTLALMCESAAGRLSGYSIAGAPDNHRLGNILTVCLAVGDQLKAETTDAQELLELLNPSCVARKDGQT